jgi:hypothetical protein
MAEDIINHGCLLQNDLLPSLGALDSYLGLDIGFPPPSQLINQTIATLHFHGFCHHSSSKVFDAFAVRNDTCIVQVDAVCRHQKDHLERRARRA